MRLTIELLRYANTYINTVGQREICLRKYAIPAIENLGILDDGYDSIDLSENSIVILENFPIMKRLNTLLLHNNKIRRIAKGLGKNLVNLENLMLTNNSILHLSDLEGIEEFEKLVRVSLIGNPVTKDRGYRLWMISRLPNLKYLDFKKIKQSEREEAKEVFGKEIEMRNQRKRESKQQEKQAKNTKQNGMNRNDTNDDNAMQRDEIEMKDSEPRPNNEMSSTQQNDDSGYVQLSQEQRAAIQNAILSARNVEEVNRLEEMLTSGRIPTKDWKSMFETI